MALSSWADVGFYGSCRLMRPGDIVTHTQMCEHEGTMLQRGMLFRPPPSSGVILMSQRANAPYRDAADLNGNILYEGHDAPKSKFIPNPKSVDQPRNLPSGKPTENGKFADWTDKHESGKVPPALFRVYEKLRDGIWTYRGLYALRSYRLERSGERQVFRFSLEPSDDSVPMSGPSTSVGVEEMSRKIPTWVKQEVYKRDKGQCVECGAKTELHFDHDFPFSKGGSSLTPQNVKLLCARHNLSKGAKIQ